ncbi:MAG: FtsQ-type POTRA domain-containing protein [Coriobacteriales bacterium]|nr:FtsQ-type POTRA domain-containing protein [Coriobacteriales bacterium]
MASRGTQRGSGTRGKSEQKPSVVGSKVGDTGGILSTHRLPRGGIREQGGLKVADGAMPDSTSVGGLRTHEAGASVLRIVAIVSAGLIVLLLVVAIAFAVLAHTSAFVIDAVEAVDTEHAKADDLVRLVTLEEGATLLSVDEAAVREAVQKNPWIASVSIERVFPDTLRIHATERTPRVMVLMGTGGTAWLLGDDGHWIEPVSLDAAEGEALRDTALAKAVEYGADLVTNVPADVAPQAGSACTDDSILAALSFEEQFSKEFADSVVSYSAPGVDDISCVLSNGVEVSLGSATSVSSKEQIVRNVLDEYGGQVTYINVRVPTRPTFRYVNSPYVKEGSGANGESAVDTRTNETTHIQDTESQDAESQDSAGEEGLGTSQQDAQDSQDAQVSAGGMDGIDSTSMSYDYDASGYSYAGM